MPSHSAKDHQDDHEFVRKAQSTQRPLQGAKRKAKRFAGKAFWVWILYQSVKGTITLSLIWIPLFWLWLKQ